MAAKLIELADALVAALNAGPLSGVATAERAYDPQLDLSQEATDSLRVVVVPRSLAAARDSRALDQYEHQVDVGLLKRTDRTIADLDADMLTVEGLADYCFRGDGRVLTAGGRRYTCVAMQNDPAFAPDHLYELGQFTSVVTLTYRLWRG